MSIDLDTAMQLVDRWDRQTAMLEGSDIDYQDGVAEGLRRAANELRGLVDLLRDIDLDKSIPETHR